MADDSTDITDEAATFDSSQDYKAVLFPPILLFFFIGGFAIPVGALLYWLISPNVCFLFVLIMSRLRQHHITHHNRQLMTRFNFNITYPICDRIFGTLYRADT